MKVLVPFIIETSLIHTLEETSPEAKEKLGGEEGIKHLLEEHITPEVLFEAIDLNVNDKLSEVEIAKTLEKFLSTGLINK